MRVFLISMNLDLWNIIENGFQLPSKPMNEWSDLEKKYFSLNAMAMNALFCALDKNEFNQISTCETAFDIWRTLEITHEGTSRVKDSKVNILLHDFELFRMQPSETIGDMYTRFTDVVNSLRALGKCFSDFELVNKILRSLSKKWDSKVTAIQEAKNLNNLPLEELIGSLMTYEMVHNAHDEHDEQNHLPKNRKDLELRTNEYHLSDDSSDEDNDEQTNLPKNRKDLGHRTFEDHSSISSSDGELKLQMKRKLKSKKHGTTCFKRKKKNKNWDESSSSEEEKVNKSKVANYALTAYNVEVMPLVYFEIT